MRSGALVVALGLLLFVASASGTTLMQVPIETLFSEADHVAVDEVIDRTPVGAPEHHCGAISRGRVIHRLKGATGDVLPFGYHLFYQPGQRYLLFLVGPGQRWARIMSTNAAIMHAEAERRQVCQPVYTANEVMQYGLGALRIEPTRASSMAARANPRKRR